MIAFGDRLAAARAQGVERRLSFDGLWARH
jgi:hypothetical protein